MDLGRAEMSTRDADGSLKPRIVRGVGLSTCGKSGQGIPSLEMYSTHAEHAPRHRDAFVLVYPVRALAVLEQHQGASNGRVCRSGASEQP